MKYLAAVLLSWTGAQAAPPLQALPQPHPGSGLPPPRHLTPGERAELRRQLSEFGQPASPVGRRGTLEPMSPDRRH